MSEFSDYREAARQAILDVGAEPVMAEDFPASSASPRNACLDGVASADVCLIVLGARAGWIAPSGKTVVEEEFEEGVRRNKIVCIYVEDTSRTPDAEDLVNRLSAYVTGRFRVAFRSSETLGAAIESNLRKILVPLSFPQVGANDMAQRLELAHKADREPFARLVVAPERRDEVIDRVEIGAAAFGDLIMQIAHDKNCRLFDYQATKEMQLKNDNLVIEEAGRARRRNRGLRTRLEIDPGGVVTIDRAISPASDDPLDMGSVFYLLEKDIVEALTAGLGFVNALYGAIDVYMRHQRFLYGVVFSGVGFRSLVKKAEKRSSYSMGRDIEEGIVVEAARPIGRSVLSSPSNEVVRIVTLLSRRIGET